MTNHTEKIAFLELNAYLEIKMESNFPLESSTSSSSAGNPGAVGPAAWVMKQKWGKYHVMY